MNSWCHGERFAAAPWKYVVAGSSDTEFVAQIEFGASLKVRDIAVGDVRSVKEPCVGNRVGKADIDKRREQIKFVGKMIAPVHRHVASAEAFRGACRWGRSVQARAEVKSRPFRDIRETQIRISHTTRGGRACLRSRWLEEEIRYTHVHGKVFAKRVTNGRVCVRDKPIGVAASFIGLCPRESILLRAFGGLWPSLSHGGYRQQGWQKDNQRQTPRSRLHAFPPDLLLISGF